MSIVIYAIENKEDKSIDELCNKYLKRINGFYKANLEKLPAARVKNAQEQKEKESSTVLSKIKPTDIVILCDEGGKEFTSTSFAKHLDKTFSQLRGRLVFVIGGAYGFTDDLKGKYDSMRLSKFVFPHHLARLVLVEQIYRGISILRNMPYHHD